MDKTYDIDTRAYTVAIVVSYSRPFTKNFNRSGRRRSPSLDFLLTSLSQEGRSLHDVVVESRNKNFAHSDASEVELELIEDSGERRTLSHDMQMPLERSAVERLLDNIRLMHADMAPRLKKLRSSLPPDRARS